MAEKMTYEQMVEKACETLGGKFMSRAQIKTYLTKNFGYVNSAIAKNALKKALAKFEKKGDSFRVSKAMKEKKAGANKKAAQKAAAEAKKTAAEAKKKQEQEMQAKYDQFLELSTVTSRSAETLKSLKTQKARNA